jgi:hypothetical protein
METGEAIGAIVGLIGAGYFILKIIQAIAAAINAAEDAKESDDDDVPTV